MPEKCHAAGIYAPRTPEPDTAGRRVQYVALEAVGEALRSSVGLEWAKQICGKLTSPPKPPKPVGLVARPGMRIRTAGGGSTIYMIDDKGVPRYHTIGGNFDPVQGSSKENYGWAEVYNADEGIWVPCLGFEGTKS